MTLNKSARKAARRGQFQDFFVITGLFLLSTILIVGLMPSRSGSDSLDGYFLNLVMAIPVIIAVYFIIITFRRKISADFNIRSTGIRTKIMIGMLTIAVVPTLPIVLITSNIINKAISELFVDDSQSNMSESVRMVRQQIDRIPDDIEEELTFITALHTRGLLQFDNPQSLENSAMLSLHRGDGLSVYSYSGEGVQPLRRGSSGVDEFIRESIPHAGTHLYKVSIDRKFFVIGTTNIGNTLVVIDREIPDMLFKSLDSFEKARVRYEQRLFFVPYVRTTIGIFLLVLSIAVVVLALLLSYYFSKGIAYPILELADAANHVAKGDFSIELRRTTSDEISLLYDSFNSMVRQLRGGRKLMLHNQKLAAWKEVGSKLLHEIKNPLTPIRLSAERIRKKYLGGDDNIEAVIRTGTETIIEEVDALQRILDEFSKYARLPQVKLERESLHEIVEGCVKFFHGHEKILFRTHFAHAIPPLNLDKMMLRQALINIFKNAIEAMRYEGSLVISTTLDESSVVLVISDTGPGIPEGDMDRLFEPTFSRKANGTGLGLAIVEKIILEHDGSIFCRNSGHGAEFVITLPVERSDG